MTGGATTLVTIAGLEHAISRALEAAGTSQANAQSVARALTAAEADGQKGHGLSRVPGYAAQVRVGKVEGAAVPLATLVRPGTLRIDAAHGFAFPALDLSVKELPALAAKQGIAAAGLFRSHHAGALGLVAERLAAAGQVALMFANTPAAMAPLGGRRALLGTNPIAFAAPRRDGPPLVIDLALSEVARAKVVAAAQRDEVIPLGWAVDAGGRPTTDANAALKGTLLPAGGAKGAALALMVEVLAVALTGANFADEASSFLDDQGAPPGTGQLIIAIDPGAFGPKEPFIDRLAGIASAIEGEPGARIPGARRLALREAARRDGVTVDTRLLAEVRALGG